MEIIIFNNTIIYANNWDRYPNAFKEKKKNNYDYIKKEKWILKQKKS